MLPAILIMILIILAYREKFTLKGVGFNIKAGIIYRPKEYIRLGLALHSPDVMMLTETFNSGFAADLENLFAPNTGYDSVASSTITGNTTETNRYTTYTPGKNYPQRFLCFQGSGKYCKAKRFYYCRY